jgi:hypothetical protein
MEVHTNQGESGGEEAFHIGRNYVRNIAVVLIFCEQTFTLRPFMHLPRRFFTFLALTACLGGCRKAAPVDSRLQNPSELIEAASHGPKKIFVNPQARDAFDKLPLAAASTDDAAAVQKPSLWRKLDRSQRFDAVLLAGQVSEFLPLLNHLTESPDFRLVYVDNWGVIFTRGLPAPYVAPKIDSIGKFKDAGQSGIYLSQMALMLDAAGATAASQDYMAAALKAAPREPSVQTRAAALALARKHYPEALQFASRALELKPYDLAALEVTARTLAAAGSADAAWKVARELKNRAPSDDMNVLFLHARMASAAHAYTDEQESLEKLISLAEKNHLPATDYRVYLGQSYAHSGLARPALKQLELALKDPNISEQQRLDLTTAAATVRARAGALAQ